MAEGATLCPPLGKRENWFDLIFSGGAAAPHFLLRILKVFAEQTPSAAFQGVC